MKNGNKSRFKNLCEEITSYFRRNSNYLWGILFVLLIPIPTILINKEFGKNILIGVYSGYISGYLASKVIQADNHKIEKLESELLNLENNHEVSKTSTVLTELTVKLSQFVLGNVSFNEFDQFRNYSCTFLVSTGNPILIDVVSKTVAITPEISEEQVEAYNNSISKVQEYLKNLSTNEITVLEAIKKELDFLNGK